MDQVGTGENSKRSLVETRSCLIELTSHVVAFLQKSEDWMQVRGWLLDNQSGRTSATNLNLVFSQTLNVKKHCLWVFEHLNWRTVFLREREEANSFGQHTEEVRPRQHANLFLPNQAAPCPALKS
jgi:hypothetical protein